MFNFFNTIKGDEVMARQTFKTQRLNLFGKGSDVSWKQLRNTYDLNHRNGCKLRNEGMMIYENRTSSGVSYRVNYHQKALWLINGVFGKQVYNA